MITTSYLLLPMSAMFVLSMACIFYMALCRFIAIHKREVKISFYQTYDKGTQPARLHRIARHVQNHFEVPPLFYIACLLAFTQVTISTASLVFACLFVATRFVHTFIHLGGNNVSVRFFTFGFSLIMLTALWISIVIGLFSSASM